MILLTLRIRKRQIKLFARSSIKPGRKWICTQCWKNVKNSKIIEIFKILGENEFENSSNYKKHDSLYNVFDSAQKTPNGEIHHNRGGNSQYTKSTQPSGNGFQYEY